MASAPPDSRPSTVPPGLRCQQSWLSGSCPKSRRHQPLVGSLLNASLETVGGYSGWIASTGLIVDLAPGRSASIPVILRNRQHPRGPRLRRTARHVLAQGPDALPARARWASNERAHRPPDADRDHPPSAAPSRCQPLNPSTCRHRTHFGQRSPTHSETERSFSRRRWSVEPT
jgi:hypothetical protein